MLRKLKSAEKTDADGVLIDDAYIKNFEKSGQNLYVEDLKTGKLYELPSYNPESNESLLPILNMYGGFGSKTKEELSAGVTLP